MGELFVVSCFGTKIYFYRTKRVRSEKFCELILTANLTAKIIRFQPIIHLLATQTICLKSTPWGQLQIYDENNFQLVYYDLFLSVRNPWRCSFDKKNHAYFFCGDVGQNVRKAHEQMTEYLPMTFPFLEHGRN